MKSKIYSGFISGDSHRSYISFLLLLQFAILYRCLIRTEKKRGISTKNKRFTSLKRMLEKRADYCQLPAETTSLARLPATIIEITLRFSHPSPTHSTRDEIEPALHQLIKWLFMKSVPEILSFDISCPSTSCHLSI